MHLRAYLRSCRSNEGGSTATLLTSASSPTPALIVGGPLPPPSPLETKGVASRLGMGCAPKATASPGDPTPLSWYSARCRAASKSLGRPGASSGPRSSGAQSARREPSASTPPPERLMRRKARQSSLSYDSEQNRTMPVAQCAKLIDDASALRPQFSSRKRRLAYSLPPMGSAWSRP